MSNEYERKENKLDRWEHLLFLIAQYGGERFAAGWKMGRQTPLIKVDAMEDADTNDLMQTIVREVLALQREMGEN